MTARMSTTVETSATVTKARRSQSGQGKATSRQTTPKAKAETWDTVTALTEAVKKYGTSKDALSGVESAATALETATANAVQWIRIATVSPLTEREFGVATGGDKNSKARLQWAGMLIAASRKGSGTRTLTVREATKTANVGSQTRTKVLALCDAMAAGGDPLGTKKVDPGTGHRDGVQPGKGSKRTARSGKVTTVAPDQIAATLGLMVKAAAHISTGDVAVEVARLATELAKVATARAAALQAPASTKAKARRNAKAA